MEYTLIVPDGDSCESIAGDCSQLVCERHDENYCKLFGDIEKREGKLLHKHIKCRRLFKMPNISFYTRQGY